MKKAEVGEDQGTHYFQLPAESMAGEFVHLSVFLMFDLETLGNLRLALAV